jgi:uncharacterized small protein (DUF1192 family)
LEAEIRKLKEFLEIRSRETEEWRSKYSRIEITVTELKGSQSKLIEYENRIALLSSEIERLNQIMKRKNDEIEEWRVKYVNIEGKLSEVIFKSKSKTFSSKIFNLRSRYYKPPSDNGKVDLIRPLLN